MSVKSHAFVAALVLKGNGILVRRLVDSDNAIVKGAVQKAFSTIPQDRLLRYAELITAELEKRRGVA